MPPRIAIPMPHSSDREYGERAIRQYERAVALAGGEQVRIPLDEGASAARRLIKTCNGMLLPGSNADVDPAKFKQNRSPHTAAADPLREETDFLLLEDAYAHGKPVLCICYGLQSLNVFRSGSLIQHIPDFLPEATRTKVNHEAGRKVAIAHNVAIEPASLLAEVTGLRSSVDSPDFKVQGFSRPDKPQGADKASAPEGDHLVLRVNSSHHQSADAIGKGLRVVARCPDDGIIEALEGTSRDHFVLAVQWHPERSVDDDAASRRIFQALIDAAIATR